MKTLATAFAALALSAAPVSAASLGDRLLDARDALDHVQTAQDAMNTAIRIVRLRKEIAALPGLCENVRHIDQNNVLATDFPLFSCCAAIPEGGIGAGVAWLGLQMSWLPGTNAWKLSRMQEAAVEEIRDLIEDKAGKATIGEQLTIVGANLATACHAAVIPYVKG
ncbi:hypothetical protein [Aureimonas phyllosphaerae]|uniref:Uncharacterized protein n=1 Tax=Aureimonas phyllosphaerae TaxID=1166078 RepID=A0A7W6C0C3_9HYPH|nr:hypothetical protein [Aureimonas phyllosphaerae]MBB3938095.1 hypothetical protein [Aureimonas phyllosphaerae]MBB3962102.1 hypothetical protein [Aureimonas phyllosphaerae]SFF55980.1 hypothetical protein SAMN05216566_12825 [Aureimonas phyllosphaerae]